MFVYFAFVCVVVNAFHLLCFFMYFFVCAVFLHKDALLPIFLHDAIHLPTCFYLHHFTSMPICHLKSIHVSCIVFFEIRKILLAKSL